MKVNIIKVIIDLLAQFLEGKIENIPDIYRIYPKIIHYYNEIIRYWNKLNLIIQKTLRSINQNQIFDKRNFIHKDDCFYLMAIYFYSTYRIIWEYAQIETIIAELKPYIRVSKQIDILSRFLKQSKTFNWKSALKGKSSVEKLSIEEAIPSFVIRLLLPVMPFAFIRKNLHFMNNLTPQTNCTVRINTLRTENAESNLLHHIQQDLEQNGILFRQDSEIPELFHIPVEKRHVILQSKWYQSGYLIFQDKASAIVGNILSPRQNESICDMCAAPGLKTSLIAQHTDNSAKIIATDVHTHRIQQMKKLIWHLHTRNIHLINTDSFTLPIKSEYQFDRVLLDAPCTGSGTFLINPVLKWRQNRKFLEQNRYFQLKLLESALQILKPQGILVYATCSLYPEEGELQILKCLDILEPQKLPDWLSSSYKIANKIIPGTGRLFPTVHHTKGFFIAKFKIKK